MTVAGIKYLIFYCCQLHIYQPLLCWTRIYPAFANSVNPEQLAEEANWSGSTLFVSQNVNLYQQPWSSNLIGWKLEVGMAS